MCAPDTHVDHRRGVLDGDARSGADEPPRCAAAEGNPLDKVQHALHRYPVISPTIVLFVSCIVFTIFGDGRFQRPETIGIVLQQTAVMAPLAIGQTLIMLTAGVDLAVGTAMLLTHLVIAKAASSIRVSRRSWPC